MSDLFKDLDTKSIIVIFLLVLSGGGGLTSYFTMQSNQKLMIAEMAYLRKDTNDSLIRQTKHSEERFTRLEEKVDDMARILENQQIQDQRILKLELKVEQLQDD